MQWVYEYNYDLLSWYYNICDDSMFGVSSISLECLHFSHTASQLVQMQIILQNLSHNSTLSMKSSLVLQVKSLTSFP